MVTGWLPELQTSQIVPETQEEKMGLFLMSPVKYQAISRNPVQVLLRSDSESSPRGVGLLVSYGCRHSYGHLPPT